MVSRNRLKLFPVAVVNVLVALGLVLGAMPGEGAAAAGAGRRDHRKIVINIPSRTLWVYENNKIVRYFPVGVGRPGFPTPLGRFRVIRKVVNPAWENPYKPSGRSRISPGRHNPLGTRWIGFKPYRGGEYGIHGTNRPGSVGRFSSHGCVRMKIPDAEALFDLVDIGTPVEVVYELVLVRRHKDKVRVQVFPDVLRKGKPKLETVVQQIRQEFPTAQVDMDRLKAALQRPIQKPVEVGTIVEPDSAGDEYAKSD